MHYLLLPEGSFQLNTCKRKLPQLCAQIYKVTYRPKLTFTKELEQGKVAPTTKELEC